MMLQVETDNYLCSPRTLGPDFLPPLMHHQHAVANLGSHIRILATALDCIQGIMLVVTHSVI